MEKKREKYSIIIIEAIKEGICLENKILIGIIIISALAFIVGTIRNNQAFIQKLLLRLGGGLLGILGTNWIMASMGLGVYVGINLVTGLVVSILGFPGLLLLYGIQVCSVLGI